MVNKNNKNTCRQCGLPLEYYESILCTPCIEVQHGIDQNADKREPDDGTR